MSSPFEVPKYIVTSHPEGPIKQTIARQIGAQGLGLTLQVLITPAFDPSARMFAAIESKDFVMVALLHKVAPDAALLFEFSTIGQDEASHKRISQDAVGDMDIIVNAWHRADEFANLQYSHPVRAVPVLTGQVAIR